MQLSMSHQNRTADVFHSMKNEEKFSSLNGSIISYRTKDFQGNLELSWVFYCHASEPARIQLARQGVLSLASAEGHLAHSCALSAFSALQNKQSRGENQKTVITPWMVKYPASPQDSEDQSPKLSALWHTCGTISLLSYLGWKKLSDASQGNQIIWAEDVTRETGVAHFLQGFLLETVAAILLS